LVELNVVLFDGLGIEVGSLSARVRERRMRRMTLTVREIIAINRRATNSSFERACVREFTSRVINNRKKQGREGLS